MKDGMSHRSNLVRVGKIEAFWLTVP